jgi:hypothetical protein
MPHLKQAVLAIGALTSICFFSLPSEAAVFAPDLMVNYLKITYNPTQQTFSMQTLGPASDLILELDGTEEPEFQGLGQFSLSSLSGGSFQAEGTLDDFDGDNGIQDPFDGLLLAGSGLADFEVHSGVSSPIFTFTLNVDPDSELASLFGARVQFTVTTQTVLPNEGAGNAYEGMANIRSVVPEPSSLTIMGLMLSLAGGKFFLRRRK